MRLSSSNSTRHSCLHWVTINAFCSVTVGTLYLLGVRLVSFQFTALYEEW